MRRVGERVSTKRRKRADAGTGSPGRLRVSRLVPERDAGIKLRVPDGTLPATRTRFRYHG